MRYYLGADLGATKTHTLIVDETGRALGFGESGPGNHESVGYDGMFQSMKNGMEQALRAAGLKKEDITGAGFGVAGYDWPSEASITAETIRRLGLNQGLSLAQKKAGAWLSSQVRDQTAAAGIVNTSAKDA